MLKVILKKNILLKKLNDDYTGRLLLKKRIQKLLKLILIRQKKKILWKNYNNKPYLRFNQKLLNLIQWSVYKKHFFSNILWAKIIFFNFFKSKKILNKFEKKKKITFFNKKKRIYMLQKRLKKKLWYRPLTYRFYFKPLKKMSIFEELFVKPRIKIFKFQVSYIKNHLINFYKKFFEIYSSFLKFLFFECIKEKKNIKVLYLKNYFYKHIHRYKKKRIFIYIKKYINLRHINNFYIYKKSLYKVFWQLNARRFFRNWNIVKNYWAYLNFKRIIYKRPLKRINFFDKKIYFLKNFYIFWGFFDFVYKNPFNKLSLTKKFIKFKNFCNVYRTNFYNILMLRISSILLNSNFFNNSYYLRHVLKKGFILLNKELIFTLNIICKKWDYITINNLYKFYLFKNIINKFKYIVIPRTFQLRGGFWISKYNKDNFKWNKRIFHNIPRYLYVDYRLLLIIVLKINFINFNNKPLFSLSFNNKHNNFNYSSWFKL